MPRPEVSDALSEDSVKSNGLGSGLFRFESPEQISMFKPRDGASDLVYRLKEKAAFLRRNSRLGSRETAKIPHRRKSGSLIESRTGKILKIERLVPFRKCAEDQLSTVDNRQESGGTTRSIFLEPITTEA